MSSIVALIIAALAVVLAVALAYVPLRLVAEHMARNIRQLIERQHERRTVVRETLDRRKVAPPIQ